MCVIRLSLRAYHSSLLLSYQKMSKPQLTPVWATFTGSKLLGIISPWAGTKIQNGALLIHLVINGGRRPSPPYLSEDWYVTDFVFSSFSGDIKITPACCLPTWFTSSPAAHMDGASLPIALLFDGWSFESRSPGALLSQALISTSVSHWT